MTEITIEWDNARVLVLGEGEGGKTYLLRTLLKPFEKGRVLIITPNPEEFKDYKNRVVTTELEPACDAIGEAKLKGNLLIVMDDADVFLEKNVNDSRFSWLVKSGRHRGCGWIIVSRRTADIPTMCAKQAKSLFLFQTDLPRDIEFLNEFYYPAGDEVRELDADAHECLYIDRKARTREVITA